MRYHDDPGSCVKIWWGERLSDGCDWPGSWGMELHSIGSRNVTATPSILRHRYLQGKQQRMAPHNPDLKLLVFWFLGNLQRQCLSQQARQRGGVSSPCGSVSRRSASRHRRKGHRRCASTMKVKVPTLSTCITPPKSGNPEIVAFINDAGNLR